MRRNHQTFAATAGLAFLFLLGTVSAQPFGDVSVLHAANSAPQTAAKAPEAAFGALAAQVTADRAEGGPESEALEEQALEILDRAALEQLNGEQRNAGQLAAGAAQVEAPVSGGADLRLVNGRLASFVIHQPPIGEAYRVVRLGGNLAAYALIADFGLSGPSAVRVYAGAAGELALAGRIDRYAQKDFIDDYLELVPLPGAAAVFVTAAGRTDDLQTGIFTAWYFDGRTVTAVWSSDILEQSSYESGADGFRLTYCADADTGDTSTCQRQQRDRYVWQNAAWKRVESTTLPVPARKP
jgi:hypothetical protein